MDLSGYTLTFQEEFDTFSRKSPTNQEGVWRTWFYFGEHDGRPGKGFARSLTGNGEMQFYLDRDYTAGTGKPVGIDPFSLSGHGTLKIAGNRTPPELLPRLWKYRYTSGLITTQDSFSQRYGYFEMRAKLPAGKGLWPAFWLLPSDKTWPPEIDVLEAFGNRPNEVHVAVFSTKDASLAEWIKVDADITAEFHSYGVDWQPDRIRFYFDGKEIASTETPKNMHTTMYMLINLAVGANWPGEPDETTKFPAVLEVDYVRAYRKARGPDKTADREDAPAN